ncbi:MAG: membrane protein insertase YidC [Spirochaetia bacterium]|jgi:YidC/Oxa1 family membrane protein insertase
MDRKTLLAVVISVVVIVGGMLLQGVLFPPKPAPVTTAQQAPAAAAQQAPGATAQQAPATAQTGSTTGQQAAPAAQAGSVTTTTRTGTTAVSGVVAVPGKVVPLPDSAPPANQGETITRDTDLYTLTFASAGGTLQSAKLKKYKNTDGSPVEMIMLPKTAAEGETPFALSFGDYKSEQVSVPFSLHESTDGVTTSYDFSRSFLAPSGVPFTLHKTYVFDKDEYLFELRVTIENSVNEYPALDFGGYSYTLSFGPQIGPHYAKLDGRSDFRNYAYWADGKRQDPKVGMGSFKELDKTVTWAAVVGKYFTAIAVPASSNRIVFDSRKLVEGFDRSVVSFEMPVLKSAKNTDTFRFYLGPMKKEILSRYNDSAQNQFKVTGLHADEVVTSSILIGWLATLLKYLLDFFYLLIPNYGIAIVLVTLVTKLVFLPLTFKSSESMAKMATLNPKMQEIRTRLKDKPEKMNQEIAALYKKEKINPMSGCLPMLLQLPVFFALYNLLNSHFELRGAMFIPGWIPDLSSPETIINFGFTIPLIGWTALRGLPILMVVSQLLASKFTQPPTAAPTQGGAQMKLMTYALPVVFLFILYDMPSGLVLYWTVQNILSAFQQMYINSLKKKKDAAAAAASPPVLVKGSSKGGIKPGMKTGK